MPRFDHRNHTRSLLRLVSPITGTCLHSPPMTCNPMHPHELHQIAGHHPSTRIFTQKTHDLQSHAPDRTFPPRSPTRDTSQTPATADNRAGTPARTRPSKLTLHPNSRILSGLE